MLPVLVRHAPTRSLLLAAGLCTLWGAAACGQPAVTGVACPILAPQATAGVPEGLTLQASGGLLQVEGTLGPEGLMSHALTLGEGATVTLGLRMVDATEAQGMLSLYGPRDSQGGFGSCQQLDVADQAGQALTLGLSDADAGEYLVLVGAIRGDGSATPYQLTLSCSEGCEANTCPSLVDRGCPDIRCDGDLRRDDAGCLSCECDTTSLCAPGLSPGPWGSCVLPGCDCADAPDNPVCGADGQTWSSRCHADCGGVPVLFEGRCASRCGSLDSCEERCPGLRAVEADGCPSCACQPALPEQVSDCLACPQGEGPVCGSDGVTYASRCAARCAGARLLYPSACLERCREAPVGCDLDCDWGLVFRATTGEDPDAAQASSLSDTQSEDPGPCLSCACAPAPPTRCALDQSPVCATLPGLSEEVTVAGVCLASAIGAESARWGPCGQACDADADCADQQRCGAGLLAGRCLLAEATACDCAALVDPVCGADGQDYANRCLAACAGVPIAHLGSCCEAVSPCAEGSVARVDRRGCPSDSCLPSDSEAAEVCRQAGPNASVCDQAGESLEGSACANHQAGQAASAAWCTP